jgi:hypothetical protein
MGRAIRSIQDYREKAEECRAYAKYQLDPLVRIEMLELANHWDETARQMESGISFGTGFENTEAEGPTLC